jgi:Neuraminidase (sialidase)
VLCLLVGICTCSAANVNSLRGIEHVIVYKEPGRFCGWPANNGIWSWGNEIVVGFHLAWYKESVERHSIDREKRAERVLARSLDGGETWKLEKPEIFQRYKKGKTQSLDLPGQINFTHPDFAMTVRSGRFYVSYDRCRNWQGPYRLPEFGQHDVMARTDYIVDGQNDCMFFLTATKTDGDEGRVFCAGTTDGGKTIDFVSWIGPEPTTYAIMPATVRCSPTKLVTAIRRYERGDIKQGWIAVYSSDDNGRTWQFLANAAETGDHSGNPPSMVRLPDGRIVLAYGYRSKPHGVRAVISSDQGATWSDVIHLRDDGRTWDVGYARTVQRPDGKLVTAYYYTTEEDRQQHIAATIWDPDKVR